MKFKAWLNLLLGAVAALLAYLAFQTEVTPSEKSRIAAMDSARVTRITIGHKDQPEIRLVREAAGWRLTAPIALPADPVRVDRLLDFAQTRSESSFPATTGLARYELDPPRATLAFDDRRFEFGGSQPLSYHRYVRTGDTIHLALDTTYHHLIAPPTDYVDPKPVPAGAHIGAIRTPEFEVTQANGALRASVAGTDSDAIARFIENWRQARAMTVRPLAEDEAGAQGGASVELRFDNQPVLTLTILKRDPELVLARRDFPVVYVFPAEAVKRLLAIDTAAPRLPP
jgi:hypothetical protein